MLQIPLWRSFFAGCILLGIGKLTIPLFLQTILIFGLSSGAALATVVGVLIEVPVMLMLMGICKRTSGWFDTKKTAVGIS